MKNLAAIALVAGLSLGSIACSDDKDDNGTNPAPTFDRYLVTTAGSSWITSDTTFPADDAESPSFDGSDSVVALAAVTKLGKPCTPFVAYREGIATDTTFMYTENGKVFLYQNLNGFDAPIVEGFTITNVGLGEHWVQVADQNATGDWTALDRTSNNLTVQYGQFPLTGKASITIRGRKTGTGTMTISNTSVATASYGITATLRFEIANPLDPTTPIVATIPLSGSYVFGKNVGLVQTASPAQTVVVSGTPTGNQEVDLDGSSSTVIRYTIAN